MASGTSFPESSYGTYSVPAIGVDESITIYGWFYLPAAPANDTPLDLGTEDQSAFTIVYQSALGVWAVQHGWGTVLYGPGSSGGWTFVAVVFSRTSISCLWRQEASRDLGKDTTSWSYDGAAFTGKIGAFLGDAQHVGIVQAALTEAQLLAQSQASTPIDSAYSFFPLNENSGTGTIGGRNIALSGTAAASREAPASALPAIDATTGTEFGRVERDRSLFTDSPFATSYTITVSAWLKIGAATNNSYAISLSPGGLSNIGAEHLIFVAQHDAGSSTYASNLMSLESGDWGVCYDIVPPALSEGWVFHAWVITSSGSARVCRHYLRDSTWGSLRESSPSADTVTETGWSSDMTLSVGWAGAKFGIKHLRVHTSALTLSQLDALSLSETDDTTAWCHVPFCDTSPLDVSGNGRHATLLADAYSLPGPNYADAPSVNYLNSGALAGNAAAISPEIPVGAAEGDLLYALFATANQAISIANANGGTWTEETGSPQGTGTAAGTSAVRLTVFRSVYNGTQGAPTTNDSGDHQVGQIIAYRGQAVTDPVNITSAGVEDTSDTSWSIDGATTTADNCRVVIVAARMDDSASARFSAWTNADLTGLTERVDAGSTAGNGSGFGIADGLKATAGTYGATTVTNATATVKAWMTIALKPEPAAAAEGDIAGTAAGTATVSGAVSGLSSASGTSAGTSSTTGALATRASFAATSDGTSTVAGAASGKSSTAGTSTGTATVTGSASGLSACAATDASEASVSGAVSGLSSLSGVAAGSATTSGDIQTSATVDIAGTAAGAATLSGALSGLSAASGAGEGASTVAAQLSGLSAAAGSDASAASLSGSAGGLSSAAATAAGAATVSGSALGLSSLAANDTSSASLSGAILGLAAMAAVAAGTCVIAGNLSAAAADALEGTASGTAEAAGELYALSALSGTATGTASVSGASSGLATVGGTAAGTSSASGALSTSAVVTVAGAASGSATLSGALAALSAAAGAATGTGTATGAASAWCAVEATADGSATVTGAVLVGSPLAGTADGSATVEGAAGIASLCSATDTGTSSAAGSLLAYSSHAGAAAGASTVRGAVSIVGAGVVTGGSVSLTISTQTTAELTISPMGAIALTVT